MIYFNDNEYTERDIEKAKRNAPNVLRRCYANITRQLDDFDYGLYRSFEGDVKPSVMEILSVAYHYGVKASTVCAGVADDLETYLNTTCYDMDDEDIVTLALSEPRDDWEDDETPSWEINTVVINNFENYLESVYYSPHVQKLLKDQNFKDLLAFLNIDKAHSINDSFSNWLEVH